MENFIGRKTKKSWAMRPKQRAGARIVDPKGGRFSDARAKVKQQAPPKKDKK